MSKLVYLAGPITGCSYEEARNGWRADIAKLIHPPTLVLSPMRQEGHLKEVVNISGMGIDSHFWSKARAIFTKDKFDIQRSDVVICNLMDTSRVSIGTCVELGWADAWGKPIILMMEPEEIAKADNPHHHLFCYEAADFVVHSLVDAAAVANGLLSTGV